MNDELKALAERVQALAGPCDEMDALIFMALHRPDWREGSPWKKTNGWFKPNNARDAFAYFFHDGMGGRITSIPRYTASLDAAMTLVPDDYDWAVFRTNGGLTIHAWCGNREDVFGESPALALTAAALLARAT